MTILINFLGAPSVGKSTTAGKLFAKLKDWELNAELVQEYVKGWAWDGRTVSPYDQFYFFGKEVHNQSHLFNKVDFVIADSPVILAAFYHMQRNKENSLRDACKAFYTMAEKIDNVKIVNFLLTRKKKYQTKGRFHTQEQADEIERLLRCFLSVENYEFIELTCADEDRIDVIIETLSLMTNGFREI